jgi:hypothetical protein
MAVILFFGTLWLANHCVKTDKKFETAIMEVNVNMTAAMLYVLIFIGLFLFALLLGSPGGGVSITL